MAAQKFEEVLSDSSDQVADFSQQHRGFVAAFQHRLHVNPALVPLIVLVISIAIFGILLGTKFFSAFALTLILQQVAIVGIVGAAQSGPDGLQPASKLYRCRVLAAGRT